jgi:hypothetical protein
MQQGGSIANAATFFVVIFFIVCFISTLKPYTRITEHASLPCHMTVTSVAASQVEHGVPGLDWQATRWQRDEEPATLDTHVRSLCCSGSCSC